jgi:hypothetical protein
MSKNSQLKLPLGGYRPGDVIVEHVSADMYKCHTTLGGITTNFNVSPPEDYSSADEWMESLSDWEVEAGIQIYWDSWNFGDGAIRDRYAYDVLEEERTRRSQSSQHSLSRSINLLNH